MGQCCVAPTSLGDIFNKETSNMPLKRLKPETIKDYFYTEDEKKVINGYNLEKLSPESLSYYKNSLKTMSYDEFLKLSYKHFIIETNIYQNELLKQIYNFSQKRKAFLYLIIVTLTYSTPDAKLKAFKESIFSLEDVQQVKYYDLKDMIKKYLSCVLISPVAAVKETTKEQLLKNNAITVLKDEYNEQYIDDFMDQLTDKYENEKFLDHDSFSLIDCKEKDISDILDYKKDVFFDFTLLKSTFNRKYGFE